MLLRNIAKSRSACALVIINGGESTVWLPIGRTIKPLSRQASNTLSATRTLASKGVLRCLSATYSIPTMK